MNPKSLIAAQLAVVSALAIFAAPLEAAEKEWYSYENEDFIAYSSSNEKKVRAILEDLALVRAAMSQLTHLPLSESGPKTEVLVLKSKNDIVKIQGGKSSGGFTHIRDGRLLIVVPASGYTDWARAIVRHNYAHELMRQMGRSFPQWYEEGFADLVTAVEFRDRNKAFVVGKHPDELFYAIWDKVHQVDWNALISMGWPSFEHTFTELRQMRRQSWLLTHYVTLGDDFGYARQLAWYLEQTNAGQDPLEAFVQAFGMDGNALWQTVLDHYRQRTFFVIGDFSPGVVRTDFSRSAADPAEIDSLLEYVNSAGLSFKGRWGFIDPSKTALR
jgi:hypothetical protein